MIQNDLERKEVIGSINHSASELETRSICDADIVYEKLNKIMMTTVKCQLFRLYTAFYSLPDCQYCDKQAD